MVTSGSRVDLRRATELTGDEHHRAVEESAIIEIADQASDRLIERRCLSAHRVLNTSVMIPPAVANGDETDSRLDQSSSEQQTHSRFVLPVLLFG